MKEIGCAFILLLILPALACAGGLRLAVSGTEDPRRQRIVDDAAEFIGVTEATGHNDGPEIERILASAGLSKGDPHCAAFCRHIYDLGGLQDVGPRNGWAPSWVAGATWKRGEGEIPLPGDIGGIYFSSMGRVGHVFIVREWRRDSVITIEANTSPDAAFGGSKDREGEGIWSKRRLVRQVYVVRNWLDATSVP